jgi:hypothetical protein
MDGLIVRLKVLKHLVKNTQNPTLFVKDVDVDHSTTRKKHALNVDILQLKLVHVYFILISQLE